MNTNDVINEKESACVLIYNPSNGMFLAVTRKEDVTKIGMPGGKCDLNESRREAAQRELLEETGIFCSVFELELFFTERCGEYLASAFYVEYDETVHGEPRPKEVGVTPVWVYADDLIENSPFGEFNLKVIDKFLERHV